MPEPKLSTYGRLARVTTSDHLDLQGFLAEPREASSDIIFLHIHGMFENFHIPLFIESLAANLVEAGHSFLTMNTRAQDYHVELRKWDDGKPTWAEWGGSYEIFRNCLIDINAWVNFCATHLGKRVVLMGHSHGALKAAFYCARGRDTAGIVGLVMLSPSDDVGGQRQNLGGRYDEALSFAQNWVQNGRQRDILPSWLYGEAVTAEMYLDMFRLESDVAIFPFHDMRTANGAAAEVHHPTLAVFAESDVATAGVQSNSAIDIIRKAMTAASRVDGVVIAGTNHQYAGHEEELAQAVVEWCERLSADIQF